MTLDNLALLLAEVDPTSRSDAEHLLEALREVERGDLSEHAGDLIGRAAAKVETALAAGRDVDSAVLEASRLVEWAMLPIEDDLFAESANVSDESPSPLGDDADLELLAGFVTECREHLAEAEAGLLAMESDPDDRDACDSVFRAFHTVKGGAAFLGLDDLTAFAHEAESVLSRVRDRDLRYAGDVPDLALRSVDMVGALIDGVEVAMGGGTLDRPDGYAELHMALSVADDAEDPRGGSPETAPPGATAARAEESPASTGEGDRVPAQSPRAADSAVRVRTDRLDRLIDLVGELVIAQSMLAEDPDVADERSAGLTRKVSHAGKIVRDLQDLSVSLRMVPFRATFQKMTRVVRDVAQRQGKKVEFVTDGEDTEIDRGMVDVIADPLVHMIRNAVDHGIETPKVREAVGKPPTGRVVLSAQHAGGNVVVEMTDDGNGLDRDRILEKAISKGIVESGAGMTDSEIFGLIFAPGFSTAEAVTDVSGRGVGMDVVRRHVESLRGRIDIASTPGKGSTFTIRFPLTLAITDGMLIRVGQERYIVPTAHIHLSFRPDRRAISTVQGRGEVVRLREELLPIVRVHRLLDVDGAETVPEKALLMVVGAGERRCALLVDELLGQQQVVAKTLGEGMRKVAGVSGGAILGDGRVGLILDTRELVALASGAPGERATAEARKTA